MNQDQTNTQEALTQYVVFLLDQEEYAVAISDVSEVLPGQEITPVPDSPAYLLGIINLRGKIVPIVDLEKRFSLVREHPAEQEHIVITTDSKGALFGISVDRVKKLLRVPAAQIKQAPSVKSKIAPEYILGVIVIDGAEGEARGSNQNELLLLLDIKRILSDEEVPGAETPAVPATV